MAILFVIIILLIQTNTMNTKEELEALRHTLWLCIRMKKEINKLREEVVGVKRFIIDYVEPSEQQQKKGKKCKVINLFDHVKKTN